MFGKEHIIIKDIAIISVEGEDFVEELHFTVKMPHKLNLDQTLEKLSAIDNLIKIMIDDIEINIGAKI